MSTLKVLDHDQECITESVSYVDMYFTDSIRRSQEMIFQLGGVHGNGNVRTVQDVFSMDIKDLRFCYIVASFKIDQFFFKSGAHIHNIFILALFASTFIKIHIKRLWVASFRTKKYIKHRERKYIILLFSTLFFFLRFFSSLA